MRLTIPKITLTTTDVSLIFGLPILAYSEWRFGTEVLGLPQVSVFGFTLSLALFVPGFLDTYVVAAMRRGGSEVAWALGLVVMSVTGSATAHLYQLSAGEKVLASAGFGVMLAVVIWRVKHIAHADSPATAAAKHAAAQAESLAAELAAARARTQQVAADLEAARQGAQAAAAAQETAAAAAADRDREHERELTDLAHRHEVQITRLRGQLDAARATSTGTNVVALRPARDTHTDDDSDVETRQATDRELLAVLVPLVRANPALGRPTALDAVRDAGLACGSQRVRDLLARAKAEAARGQDDGDGEDLAVTS